MEDEATLEGPAASATARPTPRNAEDPIPAENSCAPEQEPVIELAWTQLVRNEHVSLAPSQPAIEIEHVTAKELSARLLLRVSDGAQNTRAVDLGAVVLAAGESRTLVADLSAAKFDLPELKFSGSAHVSAIVRPSEGGEVHVTSETIYFHPVPDDKVAVYDEATMRSVFNRGDYKGELQIAALEAPGTEIDRIIHGGAGVVTAQPPTDDESGKEPVP